MSEHFRAGDPSYLVAVLRELREETERLAATHSEEVGRLREQLEEVSAKLDAGVAGSIDRRLREEPVRTVSEIMSRAVVTVEPSTRASEVARRLVENEISGAPVVDRGGVLRGVVSASDLLRLVAEDGGRSDRFVDLFWDEDELVGYEPPSDDPPASEFMTSVADEIEESATTAEAASRMLEGRHHRLVVSRDREVVGIVTATDLLRLVAGGAT